MELSVEAGGIALSREKTALEYVDSVIVQVGVLLSREFAYSHAGIDAPCIQKLVPNLRNSDELLAAGEGDIALVE